MGRPGELDVALPVSSAEVPDLAAAAERAGVAGVWVHEAANDGFVSATAAGMSTRRTLVGTDVAVAFARSPAITAMAGLDIHELTGGRFVVGLGSQVRRIVQDRYSASFDRPARRMAEYLQALRAVWRTAGGEHTTFEGEFFRVRLPGAYPRTPSSVGSPPVYLAAVGPLMTQVAVEHADGILGHPLTSLSFLRERFVPRIGDRAHDPDFAVCTGLIASVDDDREAAVARARMQIAFYGTTPNYREIFDATGDEGLTDRLREAWRSDRSQLARALPADAADRYAVAGTPDELAGRLQPYLESADRVVVSVPSAGLSAEERAAVTRSLLAAIAETRS